MAGRIYSGAGLLLISLALGRVPVTKVHIFSTASAYKRHHNRSLSLLYPFVILNSPTPNAILTWWRSSNGYEAGPSRPPGVGGRSLLGGCVPVSSCTDRLPLTLCCQHDFARATSSSPRNNVTPSTYTASHDPAMVRKGFI